jgi:UDP-GlcNAc:undecaprenyl-phosphate GlcNAc-1-phosphate transferase
LHQVIIIAGAGLGFFLIGLLDDKRGLSVRSRFVLEFLLAGSLVAGGVCFDLGFLPKPLVMVITAIWIVGIANAFNLLDGLDGLAGGVAVICSCILAVVMIRGNQPLVTMFLAVLAGSVAGFLRHNIFPATIFMGSSGSLFLGYALSVSVVLGTFIIEGGSAAFPILMPILLLGVPLYDTASVVFIRLREHRPIFKSDRSHTHHRLLSAGFSEKWAVVFIWLLTLMVGIDSVLLVTADLWASIMIFSQVTLAFALIVLVKHIRIRPLSSIKAERFHEWRSSDVAVTSTNAAEKSDDSQRKSERDAVEVQC